MRRVESQELLDHGEVAPADRERSLRDLRRINRLFGAHRAYKLLVGRLTSAPVRAILDLGTGSSDLLEKTRALKRIGLDLKIEHLLFEPRDQGIYRVAADAMHLPFKDNSVDIVASSHFFHHFSPEANAAILRESLRVARVGAFATDTKRHRVALAAVQALSATPLLGTVTRNDAPASVRQGYTAAEVDEIARKLPARRVEILSIFPFRFGLVLWKST